MKDVNPEQKFVARLEAWFRDVDTRGAAHDSLLREVIPERLREGRPFARELASFAYGDTPPAVVNRLLEKAGANPRDSFLDLGCGCGIPTLVASFITERARGVDLLPGVLRIARQAAEELGRGNVSFEQADIEKVEIRETLIYCATTSLEPEIVAAVAAHLVQAPGARRAVILGKPLSHPGLRVEQRITCRFSWGGPGEGTKHEVFIYKKV